MASEDQDTVRDVQTAPLQLGPKSHKQKSVKVDKNVLSTKRRCVSSACIACRRRKSKCDGNTPSCAACASVYGTECVYDPNSDHRRKGVYKKDIDTLKTRNTTLQTLIQGILNYPESEVYDLVKQIRTCESLEDVAEEILARDAAFGDDQDDENVDDAISEDDSPLPGPKIEREISGKMGQLRLENGAVRFLGGTSNLLYLDPELGLSGDSLDCTVDTAYQRQEDAITSWTSVTTDTDLILHLLNMYFTWHYTYFTTLSKSLFFRDFFRGKPKDFTLRYEYCTSTLVNAMLALGCHFTAWPAARSDPEDPTTAGDQFFKEARRLIIEHDEFENPRLATVQALALMSVREAGCGREPKGWVYSGMSFRMACDLGLNLGLTLDGNSSSLDEEEVDARRITFWGCFLFDKCWSNYLGRPPQLPISNITTPKFDVFPSEDADLWSPWTDTGLDKSHTQPSRTRAVALQISALCEISSDLLLTFYRPAQLKKPLSKQAEVKRLSDFHTRLEAWRKNLPKEMEPREGQLPNVLLMHMFFHLLFIHLFRPFLKHTQSSSPLPSHVSPRKICTQAAIGISKLLRLYKKTYSLKQICNIAVYIAHSACTIHLLNLPDKDARRDISHGVRHLEEIAECWLCARRTLATLSIQARRWKIELPEDAAAVLRRWEALYRDDHSSPNFGKTSPALEHMHQKSTSMPQRLSPATVVRPPLATVKLPASNESDPFGEATHGVAATDIGSLITGSQQLPQRTHAQWDAVAPISVSTEPRRNSPAAIFGGLDTLFEDSKDWWLRDQSTFFEHWSRRESSSANTSSMASMPPINDMTGLSSENMTASNGIGLQPETDSNMNSINPWEFNGNNFAYGGHLNY